MTDMGWVTTVPVARRHGASAGNLVLLVANVLLTCAHVYGHADTVQVLVTLGADLKSKNQQGETAVKMGKRVGTDKEVLEFLEQFMTLVDPDHKGT